MGFKDKALCTLLLMACVFVFQVRALEVSSISLGIESEGAIMTKMIPRGAICPIRKSQTFTTYLNQQTSVLIKVYEGESVWTKDCEEIGRFELSGIAPAPSGVAQIEVTFLLDTNYTLHVMAQDKLTKKSKAITISCPRKAVVEEHKNEAEEYQEEDQKMIHRIEPWKNKQTQFNMKTSTIFI